MAARTKRKTATRPRRKVGKKSTRGRRLLLGFVLTLFAVVTGSGVQYYRSPESLRDPFEAIVSSFPATQDTTRSAPTEAGFVVAHVQRVVDGDTIEVEIAGRKEKVRLLNVDTPESVHSDKSRNTAFGREAAEYTRVRLSDAQVRLYSGGGNAYDNFGRRLAYVFVDGVNFNEELVREGYSEYYVKYGRSGAYDKDFRDAESEARMHKRGIWSEKLVGAIGK